MTEPRKCKKCGATAITVEWIQIGDHLFCGCDICGFEWTEDCMDKLKALEALCTDAPNGLTKE